jgi:hypothetical protein
MNNQIGIPNGEVTTFVALTAVLDASRGTGVFTCIQPRVTPLGKLAPWHEVRPMAELHAYGAPRVRSAHHASVILRSRGPAKPQ